MKPVSAIFILIAVAFSHAADVEIKENTVTFERMDNGLYWPLPDNYNPGILMIHGRHCYKVLEEPGNKTGEMTKMHQEHCKALMARILHFLVSNPAYQVKDRICKSLLGEPLPYQLARPQNSLMPDGIHHSDASSNHKTAKIFWLQIAQTFMGIRHHEFARSIFWLQNDQIFILTRLRQKESQICCL